MTRNDGPDQWFAGRGDLAALIAGFVAGNSLADIATASGLSVSTVQRRRREPLVAQAIAEAQRDQRERVVGRLAALRSQAMDVLAQLLEEDQPTIRLRAATVVLTQCLRHEVCAQDAGEARVADSRVEDPDAERMLWEQTSPDGWNELPVGGGEGSE